MRGLRSLCRALPVLLVSVGALAGCVSMPDSGPVVETRSSGGVSTQQGPYINPRPPRPGDTRADVVKGFLNAMTATPLQTNTAREFLTEDAAAAWTPEDRTITYAGVPRVVESASRVRVTLSDADGLDAQGAWQGPVPQRDRVLDVPMSFEDGEWRIDQAPNALIVPESWFADRYRAVSIYYFDPTASTLVPEPVFVPTGKQLASALTQALLHGPGARLDQVVQSFVPPGLKLNLSVPISADGIADIALKGDAGTLTSQSIELMLAQLAWTLRQEPTITSLRISIDGQPMPLPGGVSSYRVDGGAEFDPAGFQASPLLYGLRSGRLASGSSPSIGPVSGPFGATALGLRSIAVSLTASTAAGVTTDGRTVLQGPVSGPAKAGARPVVSGARDLLRPAWDLADRLWLVDRAAGAARVAWVRDGRIHDIAVPGVTGRDVRSFLVSRDGTRLVAVVRRPQGDGLVVSRIAHDRSGRVLGASRARTISGASQRDLPMRAIAWASPTTIAILSPFPTTRSLVQLSLAAIDGSPAPDGTSTTVEGRLQSVAGSPVPGEPLYGVSRGSLVNLSSADRRVIQLPAGTSDLTYAG